MSMSKLFPCGVVRLALVLIIISLVGCAKDPYEVEIQRFYYESNNRSVKIQDNTVDTTITFEQAKPWLEKKLDRVKERLKAAYAQQYEAARLAPKRDGALLNSLKAKLDSANAGLYSPDNHEVKAYSAFLTDKPSFEQVTLRYKVWQLGTVREQVFVRKLTAKDTTLTVTEKSVAEYLKY
jgi:hypothetical protein